MKTAYTELLFFNARFYDPQLGRFVSADTIVPRPADPQSFNRYSYGLNNPLKYIDPSGHDVMIVGGNGADPYGDPMEYKAWVMAYKGWSEVDWNSYYDEWMNPNSNRAALMNRTGIHYFTQSSGQVNDDLLRKLSGEMTGMKDITLIGHSWGANVIMNYLAKQSGLEGLIHVSQFITIKPPQGFIQGAARGAEPGAPFYRGTRRVCSNGICTTQPSLYRSLGPTDASLVNIYSPTDPVSWFGHIDGAINMISNDPQDHPIYGLVTHGNAPALAVDALLAVGAGHDVNSNMMALPD